MYGQEHISLKEQKDMHLPRKRLSFENVPTVVTLSFLARIVFH